MSDREQLLHLVDRARRGVALPAELDQLAAGITEQAARITTLEHVAAGNKRHVQLVVPELEKAEAVIERVRAELDRIADLDTVRHDDGRADRFSTGARWALRMIRENAVAEQQPTT